MPFSIVKLDPYSNTGLDFGNKVNEIIDGLYTVTAIDSPPPTSPYVHNTLYPNPFLIREIQVSGSPRHFREYSDLPDGGVKGLTTNSVSEYILTFNAYYATYTFSANTTINDSTLAVSSTTALEVGDSLIGSGIPTGATISSIGGSTAVVMSTTATATASSVPITGKTWRKDSTAAGHYSMMERITEGYVKEWWYSSATGSTPIIFYLKHSIDMASGGIIPKTSISTTGTTAVPDVSSADIIVFTALTTAIGVGPPIGAPTTGRTLVFRFKDDGTGRAITWDAIYRNMGTTLPTTTVANKITYCNFIYNSTDSKWDLLQVNQEV